MRAIPFLVENFRQKMVKSTSTYERGDFDEKSYFNTRAPIDAPFTP